MLISYRHDFLFFHVYKVAGTSMRRALEPFAHRPETRPVNRLLARSGWKHGLPLHRWRVPPVHSKAREARAWLPRAIWEGFFKFAFVRNPWDWQVSLYHYMLGKASHKQHRLMQGLESFEEYIEWRVREDRHLQSEFVTNEGGRIIVDFVGRFERLGEDFGHVCRVVGIDAELPHVNPSRHDDYRTYYSERARRLVAEHFAEDIERFGYRFEDG